MPEQGQAEFRRVTGVEVGGALVGGVGGLLGAVVISQINEIQVSNAEAKIEPVEQKVNAYKLVKKESQIGLTASQEGELASYQGQYQLLVDAKPHELNNKEYLGISGGLAVTGAMAVAVGLHIGRRIKRRAEQAIRDFPKIKPIKLDNRE